MLNKNDGPAKIFVESGESRIIDGMSYLAFQSGAEKYTFVLPLPLAKVLGLAIAEQIGEMEKKTGQNFSGGNIARSVPSPFGQGNNSSK